MSASPSFRVKVFLSSPSPKSQVQSPKVKTKGTWADNKIPWATHPTPPITFKPEGVLQ